MAYKDKRDATAARKRLRANRTPEKIRADRRADAARKRAARHRAILNRRKKTRRDAIELDAIRAGASIVDSATLRRPTFVVITPQGRRVETLEPDLI